MTDARHHRRADLRRIAIIPDAHHPYDCKEAVDALLEALQRWEPEELVVLGDWWDCYQCSTFTKDPARPFKMHEEIDLGQRALRRFEDIKSVKARTFCLGNHEARLQRYIAEAAPAMWNLVPTWEAIIGDKWDVVPYMKTKRIGKLYVSHEFGSFGQNSVRQALAATNKNVVFGHTHRLEQIYSGTIDGERHVGTTAGWLGSVEQVDYRHQVLSARDYTLGCAIAHLDKEGFAHVTPVPFVKGKFFL